jgi:hypothetical protein
MADDFTYNPGVQSTAAQSYSKGNSMLLNALMALLTSGKGGGSGAAATGTDYNTPGMAGTDYVAGSTQPTPGVQRGMNGY